MVLTVFTDSQIFPVLFRSLSPASERIGTICAVERVPPKPSPGTDRTLISSVDLGSPLMGFSTRFEIPMNLSLKVLALDDRPQARGDSMDNTSPINSLSEYQDFALPAFRDPNATRSSPTHSHSGLCTRAMGSLVAAQPVAIRRSWSVHVRFPLLPATVYKIDSHFNKPSPEVFPKEKPLCQIFTESCDSRDEVTLLSPGDPTLLHACFTLCPNLNVTKPRV
ncbi:hypothetical protein FGIG_11894 [Fasciola gigantica]|uniref:Uncharacterized protein n=1 Tax=Fasciola gigantica TaxID=46835 RepID=A0A504YJS0_FASGI|nr:hypothetical protein FGIG_11894 [Fasciola gigantica]